MNLLFIVILVIYKSPVLPFVRKFVNLLLKYHYLKY